MKRSDTTATIYKALAAFQRDVENVAATATNPAFKSRYTRLDTLLDAVRPAMAKHGLCVLQDTQGDGASVQVVTHIGHESGEWIESEPLVLRADKPTAQGQGSAITYGRRYQLSAMLGIADDKDDDGNAAEPARSAPAPAAKPKPQPAKAPAAKPKPQPAKAPEALPDGKITDDEYRHIIQAAVDQYGKDVAMGIIKDQMTKMGIATLRDLKQSDYQWFLAAVAGSGEQQALPCG